MPWLCWCYRPEPGDSRDRAVGQQPSEGPGPAVCQGPQAPPLQVPFSWQYELDRGGWQPGKKGMFQSNVPWLSRFNNKSIMNKFQNGNQLLKTTVWGHKVTQLYRWYQISLCMCVGWLCYQDSLLHSAQSPLHLVMQGSSPTPDSLSSARSPAFSFDTSLVRPRPLRNPNPVEMKWIWKLLITYSKKTEKIF